MVFQSFADAGVVAKLGMLIAFGTIVLGLLCALRPTERLLALMRPLSLAAVFAGLCSFTVGVAIVLQGVAVTGKISDVGWPAVAMGASETFGALFVTFGCLTVAWLLVGIAVWRGGVEAG